MSFRTVVIESKTRLTYKNRYLVVKREQDEKYIHLSEIDTMVIDSTAVSISTYLINELFKARINVIFCDIRHNPCGVLTALYSSHNTSKKILLQTKWKKQTKELLWTDIVKNKIENQSYLLQKISSNMSELLTKYVMEVQLGDKTNREGHAAKVYFNSLFGNNFSRNDDNIVNSALNYGYALLLSTISKEIVSNGYLTQLGINHKNEYNEFNLSCDFMEPFRIIIDNYVYYNLPEQFNTEYKLKLINILNEKFKYEGKIYTLKEILKRYVYNNLSVLSENKVYKSFLLYEE